MCVKIPGKFTFDKSKMKHRISPIKNTNSQTAEKKYKGVKLIKPDWR